MDGSSGAFESLIRYLGHIQDREIRIAALGAKLREMDPETAARFLFEIRRRVGRRDDEEALPAHDALLDLGPLREKLGEQRIRLICEAARQMGLRPVPELLEEQPKPGARPPVGKTRTTLPVFEGVRLGARRYLAIRAKKSWLSRLLHDQDPRVIRRILLNPGVSEDQVLRIASKAPTSPEVLREIARSSRWISRHRVKRALILNPCTPLSVSARLLGFLMTQDLREILASPNISPELRDRANQVLKEKRGRNHLYARGRPS